MRLFITETNKKMAILNDVRHRVFTAKKCYYDSRFDAHNNHRVKNRQDWKSGVSGGCSKVRFYQLFDN